MRNKSLVTIVTTISAIVLLGLYLLLSAEIEDPNGPLIGGVVIILLIVIVIDIVIFKTKHRGYIYGFNALNLDKVSITKISIISTVVPTAVNYLLRHVTYVYRLPLHCFFLSVVVIINIILIKSRAQIHSNEAGNSNITDKAFEKSPIATVSIIMSALSYIGALALHTHMNILLLFFGGILVSSGFLQSVIAVIIVTLVNIVIYGENKSNHHIHNFKEEHYSIDNYDSDNPLGSAYCDIAKHVLLLIFTFGIWYLIWIYRTTEYLNRFPKADKYSPLNQLLLCMFVPFYMIFWFYKQGQRTDSFAKSLKIDSDIGTICLITGIFIPFVAAILIQDKINAISKSAE